LNKYGLIGDHLQYETVEAAKKWTEIQSV